MTKATQAASLLAIAVIAWAVLMVAPLPSPLQEVVPVLPFWAIVSFGAYLLGTLGWNIFTFQDKEAAYRSLLVEIDEAKRELRKQGVTVDAN